MSDLTLYTTSTCGFCLRLKGRLDKAGVAYVEHDVDSDGEAAAFVEETNGGPRTVPVVVYPDGTVAVNPAPRDVLAVTGN